MNRVTHFEIYTEDPETVLPFYQDVFGWKFQKFEGGPIEYWLVTTGDDKEPGINGGMTRPREGQSPGTLNTVAVKSLDQTSLELSSRMRTPNKRKKEEYDSKYHSTSPRPPSDTRKDLQGISRS